MSKIISHLKGLDWLVIVCVISLCIIGLVSIYSSSGVDLSSFRKQIYFIGMGIVLMILLSVVDWRLFREEPYLLLLFYLSLVLLLAGLLIFGSETRGIRGWYRLGPISFDPLPFTEIALIILLAKYFSKRHVELYNMKHIIVSGLYALTPFLLVFLQPDLGSALLLGATWLGVLLVSGIKTKHLLVLVLLGLIVLALGWSVILKPYQRERVMGFLFSDDQGQGVGWSQRQAKIAIGSGGLLGKGFQRGSQVQLGFLTLPQTDFIYAAISEEFGWIGGTLTILLITILCLRMVFLAFKSGSNFPRLFAIGLSVIIMFQSFVHVGVNLALLPVIGLPLPFVSYGGSHLIAYFMGLGIFQSLTVHPEK